MIFVIASIGVARIAPGTPHIQADINITAVWGTGDIDPKPIGFEVVRV